MKKFNLLKTSVLFALLVLCGRLFPQVQTFPWQGIQREYIVKMPTQHNETVPILFFLHGLGDNITRLDNEFHFQQIADEFGWIMVIPQARNEGLGTMWNAGLMNSNTDDSGFLMALLDALAGQYPVNADSVFFTGFSMGGFMSHRMAIEHGDRIAACAPVSGLITHSLAAQTPVAPVRMLHIHGTADPVVGYNGSSQYFGMNLGLSVESILNYWKDANHCADQPIIDTFPDLHNDGLRFVRYTYSGDPEVQHIKVIGGDHTWYHSEDQYDVSYLTEIRKFFIGNGGSIGLAETGRDALCLWPNPTSGHCTIETETATTVEVKDMLGRTVATHQLNAGANRLDLSALPAGMYFVKGANGAVVKVMVSPR